MSTRTDADDTLPSVVEESKKKITKIAKTLTAPGSLIAKYDEDTFYSQGKKFEELDSIRELKLANIAKQVHANRAEERNDVRGMTRKDKKTWQQVEKMLEHAKAGKPMEVPMTPIIIAADNLRDAGLHKESDMLYTYAIQQAERIEAKVLEENKTREEKKEEVVATMTDQLKEYKWHVDVIVGRIRVNDLKIFREQEKEKPEMSAIPDDVARKVAAMDSITLERDINNLPAKLKAKSLTAA